MICRTGSKPSTQGDRGFTLLEVLVSLAIMAMITTVAFAGLSIGIDSWHRGSRKIDELDNRFALERVMQRQIALADSVFHGNRDELEFSTTYSLANGSGDPVRVKYVLDPNGLVYSETSLVQYAPDPTVRTFPASSSNGFQYLYAVPGSQYDWFTEPMNSLPLAVRVDLSGDVLTIPLVNRQ